MENAVSTARTDAELPARLRGAALAALILFSFFAGIGSTLLFDWDEGAFSEATREMLVRNDYVSTYLNDDYRSAKPILIYWLQASAAKLFGINEFSMRLPSALSASLWAAALFFFLKRTADAKTAFFGAVFLVGALQVSVIGRAAISDALLNLWIACSMFAVFLFQATGRQRWSYLAFAAIGFGALTKGPIAVLIPGVVSTVFFTLRRRWDEYFRLWLNPGGVAIFAAITAPWFILQYQAHGQAFIDGFFLKHNVGRFTGAMEGHGGGPWYYIPVVLIGLLPFTAFLIHPLRSIRAAFDDDLRLFAWLWFAFVFLFFSLAGTKLPHYVIYGYTGLIIVMALESRTFPGGLAYAPPLLLCAIFLFLPEILGLILPGVKDRYGAAAMQGAIQEMNLEYRLWTAGCALIYLTLIFARKLSADRSVLAAALAMTALLNFAVVPALSRTLQVPVREAAELARQDGGKVVFWKFYWPSFLFYYGKTVETRLPKVGELILLKEFELKYLQSYDLLYNKHGLALARVTQMSQDHYIRMMIE